MSYSQAKRVDYDVVVEELNVEIERLLMTLRCDVSSYTVVTTNNNNNNNNNNNAAKEVYEGSSEDANVVNGQSADEENNAKQEPKVKSFSLI